MARTLRLLLLAALSGSAVAADNAATWKPWLEQGAQPAQAISVAFPSSAELVRMRANRGWIEQWASQAPSVAWGDVAVGLVVKYQQNPQRAGRAFAYLHTAIHDALVACARRGCEPAVRAVAMHAAAGRMLDHLYPDESRGRLEALGHSAATAVLAANGAQAQAGMAWQTGRAVADNAIRRAHYDGGDMPRLPEKRPPWKPGVWRASPPLNMYDPIEPYAGQWRTWVLETGAEIEPPAPPQYGGAAFWAEVDEVRAVFAALTGDQKRIAEEWNLGAGSVTPPGVWNIHAKKLALERKLDAAQAARLFSALNAAMLDAAIACWHAKYKWWTERPVTVIRDHRDPNFMPHLVTPAHPSYPSGHACTSGAAAEVLAAFFPGETAQLQAMAKEAGMSRLYGGIHFRSDIEDGLQLGRKVGLRAIARLRDETAAQSAAPSAASTR
jgi:membrane-associated phospholipid phosphatase